MRVYFHHIGKTGGTTLRNLLVAAAGEHNVAPMVRSGKYREALSTYAALPVITGHLHVLPGDVLPRDRASITILREPVDRTLSAFFFLANSYVAGRRDSNTVRGDLDAWVAGMDSDEPPEKLNAQVASLWGFGWSKPSIPSWTERIAAAKRGLDGFDVVGICSRLEESIALVFHRLTIAPPDVVPRDNRTAGRPVVEDIAPETRRRLDRMLAPDRELFDYARKLFSAQRLRVLVDAAAVKAKALEGGFASGAAPRVVSNSAEAAVLRESDSQNGGGELRIQHVTVRGELSEREFLHVGERANIQVRFTAHRSVDDLTVGIELRDDLGALVFGTNTRLLGETFSIDPGNYTATFNFPNELGLGRYWITAALHRGESHLDECFHWIERAIGFEVVDQLTDFAGCVRLHVQARLEASDGGGHVIASPLQTESRAGFTLLGRRNAALTRFAAALATLADVPSMDRASEALIDLDIENTGAEAWPAFGKRAVFVSYHWLTASGQVVEYDGLRTSLPFDVEPATKLTVACVVRAPDVAGEMLLVWTLVQEDVAWFADRDSSSQLSWTVAVV